MRTEVIMAGLVVGACNYLFRAFPILAGKLFAGRAERKNRWVSRFLAAIGPASVASLLVVSTLPGLLSHAGSRLPTAVGFAAIVLSFRWKKSVALSILLGAIAYGITLKFLLMQAVG